MYWVVLTDCWRKPMSTWINVFSNIVGFIESTNVVCLKMHELGQETVRFWGWSRSGSRRILCTLFNGAKLWGTRSSNSMLWGTMRHSWWSEMEICNDVVQMRDFIYNWVLSIKYCNLSVVVQKPECRRGRHRHYTTPACSRNGECWLYQRNDFVWSFSRRCGQKRPHSFSLRSSK